MTEGKVGNVSELQFPSCKMGITILRILFLERLNEVVFAENVGMQSWYQIYDNVIIFICR